MSNVPSISDSLDPSSGPATQGSEPTAADEAEEALFDLDDRDALAIVRRWVAKHPTVLEDGDVEYLVTLTTTVVTEDRPPFAALPPDGHWTAT